MARRPSRFDRIRAALDAFEPQVRDAFLAAIEGITASAQIARIEERIRAGDLDGALRAVGIAASAFATFEAGIVAAYAAGGAAAVEMLPRAAARDTDGVLIRFDARNLRAEAWVREHSSRLITRVVEDQRAAVRVVLDNGLNAGRNPRATALDIVGRVDRRTGRREGGIVGLTEAQTRYVVNARAELASGDPARMQAFLQRERRDRRFDRTIARAIREGRPLAPADVDRIVGRYSDSLLQLRGESIGRTETLTAVHAAQDEALRQVVDRGQVRADAVTKEWRATRDGRTRDTHRAMNGQRVGLDGVFVTPGGHRMRYPGDAGLGAPAKETIQCFAPWVSIDTAGLRGGISREYVGDLVELSWGDGVNLAITPNHPVLTDRGWVPAGEVVESDYLVEDCFGDCRRALGEPDVEHGRARAQELYEACEALGARRRASRDVVDLHGEMPGHDVDVVALPSSLRDAFDTAGRELFGEITLAEADVSKGGRSLVRTLLSRRRHLPSGADCRMRGDSAVLAGLRRHTSGCPHVALRHAGARDAHVVQAPPHDLSRDAELFRDGQDGQTLIVEPPHIGEERSATRASAIGNSPGSSGKCLRPLNGLKPDAKEGRADGLRRHTQVTGDDRGWCATRVQGAQVVSLGSVCVGVPLPKGFAPRPDDVSVLEGRIGPLEGDASGIGGLHGGQPAQVERDDIGRAFRLVRVRAVRRFVHEGLVFNFETGNGLIVASGIVVHNCRCTVMQDVDFLLGVT